MTDRFPYIDCEVHVLPPEWCSTSYRPPADEDVITRLIYDHPDREIGLANATKDGLFQEMERAGIDGAIIMGLPWRSPDLCWRNNEYIAGLVKHHPGRFWGAGVLPAPNIENPCDAVMRISDLGLHGVKVIPSWQGWRLDDPRFTPALEMIEAQRMFLEPHTDYPFKPQEFGDPPSALFTVLCRHRELRVVAPHLAGMLCLHAMHPAFRDIFNKVLLVGSVPTTMQFIEFAAAAIGANNIAFGSDFPFNPTHDQISVRERFEQLNLSDQDKKLIAGQNALRFLKACQ